MTHEQSPANDTGSARRDRLAQRYARLQQRRSMGFLSAVLGRFNQIEGGNQATILSVTLFTTILPLIIIGFAYLHGFAGDASVGSLFDREVGLSGSLSQSVREAFGAADGVRSSWTIIGMAGFLLAGIPMAVTVAAIFARAWMREQMSFGQRLWRGVVWFVLYLVALGVHDEIAFGEDHSVVPGLLLYTASLMPVWLFWTCTPALLVRGGGRGWRFLGLAGLAGAVINGIVLAAAMRLIFPPMLAGWAGFGPMGVAMAIVTWCGVIAVGWVATACVGAVIWERSAPVDTVVEAETARDDVPESA